MTTLNKSLRLLLIAVTLAAAGLPWQTGRTLPVYADELPPPLPAECGGSTGPGGSCCIYGYVYYYDAPIDGVSVHIESPYGALDATTVSGGASSEPYYSADLSSAPLLVSPVDVITITASYSDMASARTWTVQSGGQHVDLGLFAGYQAPGPISALTADAPDLATLQTPDWWAAVQENSRHSEYRATSWGQIYLPDLPAAYHLRYNDLHAYNTIGRSPQAQVSTTSTQRAVLISHHASRFTHRADASGGVPFGAESITADTADGARSAYAAVDDDGGGYADDIAAAGSCYAQVTSTPGITYTTVQAAVDAAIGGDVVKVAGYCAGVEARDGVTQMVYINKSITLRGGYTITNWTVSDPVANPTTLDAQGQGRVIYITGDINPTVEGLRITGGDAEGLGGWIHPIFTLDGGGGIYIVGTAATISNNQIFGNTAVGGGGVFLWWGNDVTLNGNTVTANTAGSGGGLFLWWFSDATLNGNTVFSNTAVWEGGGLRLHWDSDATLNGNTVIANTASVGGGLYLADGSDATLNGNTIISNTANDGGGLYLDGSDATLINNVVADNRVEGAGSGLYVRNSSPQLRHNTIARNHGGGGEGLYVTGESPSQPQLHNTILVSHEVGVYAMAGNTVTLEATLWYGNGTDWGGDGTVITGTINVWGDPDFVDYAARDYHINAGSAAVDAGIYSFLDDDVDDDDIDGDPRPMAFGPDIGADEHFDSGLQLNKRALLPLSLSAHNPGRIVTYTLIVTGVGTGPVINVILTDTLPPEQRVVASAASTGTCATVTTPVWGGGITCTLGTLDVGDSARITLTVQITTTVPSTLPRRMRNRVWVTGTQASNFAYIDVYLQDCHVRLNDGPSEWDDIQTAVDASTQPADVVKVAGVCAGINTRDDTLQVLYIAKTMTIRGGYSPANWTTPDPVANPTTLHAAGRGRVIYITGDINPTVEGLRITGGNADGLGGYYHSLGGVIDSGGGIYIIGATAIISNNRVFNNTAVNGGGLYLQWSGATLNGNTVTTNTVNGSGGGLYLLGSAATLNGNTVAANTAGYVGGGLHLDFSDATLINNVIAGNRVECKGSGLHIEGSSPRLLHTTIARNSGGDGSGLYATDGYRHPYGYSSSVALTNTILVSHTTGVCVTAGNTVTLEATLWGTDTWANETDWGCGGTVITGSVNIWGDPAFVAPDAGDYHIGPGSAAIDEGVNAGVTVDIDGEPRPVGAGYDVGADELHAAPTADFIASPLSGTAPLYVQFTDVSTGTITTWDWTFGDGGISGARHPSHTYEDEGIYTVSLTVSGPAGSDAETKTDYITVGGSPPVAFIGWMWHEFSPGPAPQCPDVMIHFNGAAWDTDEDGAYIVAYNWRSDLDGWLSDQEDFTIPASALSVGTHPIYFKAQDDEGEWSPEDTSTLTVTPCLSQDVKTLILVNRQKLEALYSASEAISVTDKLDALEAHDSVQGLVVDLGNEITFPQVAAAYATWDADPTNTVKANAVTAAIKDVVDVKWAAHPDLEYLVIVGDDRAIPFRRVPNQAYYWWFGWRGREQDYAYVSGDSTAGSALKAEMTLTDDYYADAVPTVPDSSGWDGHALYIPDLGAGRLIETPTEITAQIDAFLAGDGVAASNAIVTGYDFVTDGAQAMCNALSDDGLTADCTLIGEGWGRDDFIAKVLNTRHDVVSINGHANHYVIGTPSGYVYSNDVASATADHRRAVFYTVGCHSGLNVPPANPYPLDTAQALVQGQANYVANTGYGWGNRYYIGLSEQLMLDFTERLVYGQSATLGQALAAAKQEYYLDEGNFDYYDEKILIESTLYGLPMYRYTTPTATAMQLQGQEATAIKEEQMTVLGDGLTVNSLSYQFPALTAESTDDGLYYTFGGLVHAGHGEPIQPKYTADLSFPQTKAHGVVFKGGAYTDVTSFDPVVDRAITTTETTTPPEPTFDAPGWYPLLLGRLNRLERGDRLVVLLGQFNPQSQTERLYHQLSFDVYYHTTSSDWTAPSITSVSSGLEGSNVTITVNVSVSDVSGIEAVVVAYTDGYGTWASTSLTGNGETTWSGSFPASADTEFFVQAVDKAGNVAVDYNNFYDYSIYLPLVLRNP